MSFSLFPPLLRHLKQDEGDTGWENFQKLCGAGLESLACLEKLSSWRHPQRAQDDYSPLPEVIR